MNLLPPEIAEEARFRSLRAVMVLAVLFAAGVAGVMYVQAAGEVTAAETQLEAAKTDTAGLQTKVDKLVDVPRVYAKVAAAQAQMDTALGSEVRYSFLLNDLSLSINKNVWLVT